MFLGLGGVNRLVCLGPSESGGYWAVNMWLDSLRLAQWNLDGSMLCSSLPY